MSTTRTKNILLGMLAALLLIVAGLFGVLLPKPVAAKAEEPTEVSVEASFEVSAARITYGGYELQVKLPSSSLDLLKNGVKTVTSHPGYFWPETLITRYDYTKYYLKLMRTNDASLYESGNVADIEGVYYTVGVGDDPIDATVQELPADFTSDGEGAILLSHSITLGDDTEYHYFVALVKCTWTRVSGPFKSLWWDSLPDSAKTGYLLNFESLSTKVSFSNRDKATEMIAAEDYATDDEKNWLMVVAGVTLTSGPIHAEFTYLTYISPGKYDQAVFGGDTDFMIPVESAFSKEAAVAEVMKLLGKKYISDFNVVYKSKVYEESPDGGVYEYETEQKVILTAYDYTYDLIYTNGEPSLVRLAVVYRDFDAKDLALFVNTVDRADASKNYTLNYYTANIVRSEETITITYSYDKLEENLRVREGWLFDSATRVVEVNGERGSVRVEQTETAIIVTCPVAEEDMLKYLDIRLLCDLDQDSAITFTYTYIALIQEEGGLAITETVMESDTIYAWYSDYVLMNMNNFMVDFGDVIEEGIRPEFLGGVLYAKPAEIQKVTVDEASGVYKINVLYNYSTIFAVTNNSNDDVEYKRANGYSSFYMGSNFVTFVPEGYRVRAITTTCEDLIIRPAVGAEDDYTKTQLQLMVGTSEKRIIPVHIEYTDTWKITVNYMTGYRDYHMETVDSTAKPCFAVKAQFNGAIKIKDYKDENILAWTDEDLARLMSQNELSILGLAGVEKIDASFNEAYGYTFDVNYGYATIRLIDYDGEAEELKLYLTSYADWCDNTIGTDWSIMMLNYPERQFFKYAQDISREDLYGFFGAAVFDTQVSDVNNLFKNHKESGCVTLFQQKKAEGNKVYKWLSRLNDKFNGAGLLTKFGMSLFEIANDKNKILYNYYFYLDGTSSMSYMGLNGADSVNDTSSAAGNWAQDVLGGIKDAWNDFTNSKGTRAVLIVLGALLIIFVVIIVYGAIQRVVRWARKGTGGSSSPKKRRRKKK